MSKLKLVRYFKYRNPNNADTSKLTLITSGDTTTEANKTYAWSSDASKVANFKTAKEADWSTADVSGVYYGNKVTLLNNMLVDQDASTVNAIFPYTTFSNVDEAKLKVGIDNSCLTASSPTVTYDLRDSSQTLRVEMAFDGATERANNKAHWDARFTAGATVYEDGVEWFKTEWVSTDDEVKVTTDPRTGS